MQWYLIIIIFILNILWGIGIFYFLFLIFFHPRKKLKLFGKELPIVGILIFFRNKIAGIIKEKYETFIERFPGGAVNVKKEELIRTIYQKIQEWTEEQVVVQKLPPFIQKPLLSFVQVVSDHFLKELFRNFIPNLAEKYKIKEKIFDLLSDKNMRFIEDKAKYYLTKPLVIIGAFFGLLFGLLNLILLIIF